MSDDSEAQAGENVGEPEDAQDIFNANFQIDMRSFLDQPVRYANVPNVTWDGHSFQFTLMTWSMPPGGIGLGNKNPLLVTARIAMPMEAVQIMLKQIEHVGISVARAEEEKRADGKQ